MAWMLEEIAKVLIAVMVGFIVKKVRRVVSENRNCMIPGCIRGASNRGMCLVCYGRAKKKVEAGETTWEWLTERGLCQPMKDPFDSAYERALDDNHPPKEVE